LFLTRSWFPWINGGKAESHMSSPASRTAKPQPSASSWLIENGPKELELLFRAVVYHPAVPILIADNDGNYQEASTGAAKLLGIPRAKLIGRKLDDFAEPAFKPQVSELWKAFLDKGEQERQLRLAGPDGRPQTVEFMARANVLPVRHVVVLQDESSHAGESVPSWVYDYALFLMDPGGRIAAWYAGAEHIYGYSADEVIGRNVAMLYPGDRPSGEGTPNAGLRDELKRAAGSGHFGSENWRVRKDGSKFWANDITMALRDEQGELQGFAGMVRDFSDRHEREEKLRRGRARSRMAAPQTAIACVACGEFDQIPEANDAFLDLIGYTRADLAEGGIRWPDLTPPECVPLDELAHEESLRFGACTPYEKELIRKDGTRVPVLVAMAVLKLSPFRWIAFVQDLRDRDRVESVVAEDPTAPQQDFAEMVGSSAPLQRVLRQVEVVAPTDATVLVLGETGTGKELVARAIHRLSPRRNQPFVTLNCAAIPTGLLESELFGYERGAFTGALSQKIGRFEMAHRGTLFLDEVGDIPLDLQPKLLRALQEKAFERLGGTRTIPIDVRLVAATNRNLTQMMGDKLFRSDLYYRLKVFPITTPPLRDRPEDVPLLVRHFTNKYAAKMGRQIEKIPSDTMKALVAWQWPGNVRELENFIERSVILSSGPNLQAPLAEIRAEAGESAGTDTLERVEREHIIRVLRESDGVVTTAATRLGLHRTTLNAMMRKLGITRRDV
jgi:PAS domain S-box-containing protein